MSIIVRCCHGGIVQCHSILSFTRSILWFTCRVHTLSCVVLNNCAVENRSVVKSIVSFTKHSGSSTVCLILARGWYLFVVGGCSC